MMTFMVLCSYGWGQYWQIWKKKKRNTAEAEAGNIHIDTDPKTTKGKNITIKNNIVIEIDKGKGKGRGRGKGKGRDKETEEKEGIIKRGSKSKKKMSSSRLKFRCRWSRMRLQCLRFQVRGERENVLALPWATTDVIRQITMVNSGTPFRGSPAWTSSPMWLTVPLQTPKRCADWW